MRPNVLVINKTLTWVIRLYNISGALVDADSTPTVAVRKNGASTADAVTVTKRTATTGIYDCSYNPAGEAEGDMFSLEETVVITASTYSNNWEFTVIAVERGTDSAATQTSLDNVSARIPAALVSGRMAAETQLITTPVVLAAAQPNYAPAIAGDAMTLTSGERTAVANEVENQIIDETDSEKVLIAITNKIAAVNPSLAGLTLAAISAAVRTELTVELARIDAAVSSRSSQVSVDTVDDLLDTEIANITTKVNSLPSDPADASDIANAINGVVSLLNTISGLVDDLEGRLSLARANALDNLVNLDAPISSRLPTISYVIPPSVVEIDNQLSNTHGVGDWSATGGGGGDCPTVEEIDEQLSNTHGSGAWGSGAGIGAYPVTITVLDEDDNPIQGALVGLTRIGDQRQGVTDIDGKVQFSSGLVTWSISIIMPSYQFTPELLVIEGITDISYNMDNNPYIVPPLDPGQVNGIAPVFDNSGNPKNGVKVYMKMTEPYTISGVFDDTEKEFISADGIVVLSKMFQGATYDIWRGRSQRRTSYTVPITDELTVDIDPILGNDSTDECLT